MLSYRLPPLPGPKPPATSRDRAAQNLFGLLAVGGPGETASENLLDPSVERAVLAKSLPDGRPCLKIADLAGRQFGAQEFEGAADLELVEIHLPHPRGQLVAEPERARLGRFLDERVQALHDRPTPHLVLDHLKNLRASMAAPLFVHLLDQTTKPAEAAFN